MKAIRKSDGKVIEVREWFSGSDGLYSDPDMNRFYQASDLDFNVEKSEEVTIDVWVARDEDGEIFFYRDKPIRDKSFWYDFFSEGSYFGLPRDFFPDVTWESDPLEVTITLKPK